MYCLRELRRVDWHEEGFGERFDERFCDHLSRPSHAVGRVFLLHCKPL